jgi:hypothetical protein
MNSLEGRLNLGCSGAGAYRFLSAGLRVLRNRSSEKERGLVVALAGLVGVERQVVTSWLADNSRPPRRRWCCSGF